MSLPKHLKTDRRGFLQTSLTSLLGIAVATPKLSFSAFINPTDALFDQSLAKVELPSISESARPFAWCGSLTRHTPFPKMKSPNSFNLFSYPFR